MGIFIFNLILLLKKKKYILAGGIINFTTILTAGYLYWNGGFAGTGIYWILALPVLYVITGGIRRGASGSEYSSSL